MLYAWYTIPTVRHFSNIWYLVDLSTTKLHVCFQLSKLRFLDKVFFEPFPTFLTMRSTLSVRRFLVESDRACLCRLFRGKPWPCSRRVLAGRAAYRFFFRFFCKTQ